MVSIAIIITLCMASPIAFAIALIFVIAVSIALAVQKEVWTNWANEILSQRYTKFYDNEIQGTYNIGFQACFAAWTQAWDLQQASNQLLNQFLFSLVGTKQVSIAIG